MITAVNVRSTDDQSALSVGIAKVKQHRSISKRQTGSKINRSGDDEYNWYRRTRLRTLSNIERVQMVLLRFGMQLNY